MPGAEAQIGAASGEAVHDESAFAGLIRHTLSEDKAEDIVVIDLAGKSSLTDLMVIASGRSARHVGALSDHLVQILKEHGVAIPKVEGMPNCDWVLIDAGDAIVHIFRPEVRAFYNLERIWSPAPVVPMQAAAN